MIVSRSASCVDGMQVRELRETELAAWSELLTRSPQGSAYCHPEYLAALCEATGARYRIIGIFLNDRLVGGVPLYERHGHAGTVVTNRLLLYYNGVVLALPARKFHSDQAAQELAALGALCEHLARRGYAHISLHNHASLMDMRAFQAAGWEVSLSYTYVVPLTDLESQWERVDKNLRRLIRRCDGQGITYREDDDFDALFRLHWQTHLRKGSPLYLSVDRFRRFFERVHKAGLARLGHAVFQGKVIASQLMLTGGYPVSHTVCAGADEDYLRVGASAFLRWNSFCALQRDGFLANDLTDASPNPVTRFKSQFGGELTPSYSVSRTDSRLYKFVEASRRGRRYLVSWSRSRSSRDAI